MIQLIEKNNFKQMPWKNGKGVTAQIWLSPEGSEFSQGQFHFRMSSASIEKNEDFSLFPGMERILIPIKGSGFQLNQDVYEKFEIARFSGDEKMNCTLLKGAVVDFGIIFNSKIVSINVKILHLKSAVQFTLEQQNQYFVSVLDGSLIHENKSLMSPETLYYFNEPLCRLNVQKSAVVCLSTVISQANNIDP